MRVALFITCFNDTLFPETGRAAVALLERLGHRWSSPRADLLRADARQHGLRRRRAPLARRFVGVFADRPSRWPLGVMRRHGPRAVRAAGPERRPQSRAGSPSCRPAGARAVQFLVDQLGLEDVGAAFRTG